jgi:adenylate kinase family enzyme
MAINRIAIIGRGGSGKSVFSRSLASQTGLPLFYMDNLFWRGKWEEVPEKEYLVKHEQLLAKDRWIIEGYIDEKMAGRLRRADLIFFLDYPGWLCAWRVLKRWLMHRKQSRQELPPEALERLKGDFFWTVLTGTEIIPLRQALQTVDPKKVLVAHWPGELKKLTNLIK